MSKTIHCATCGVPRAMSHCLEGEATSPGAQHQSIPVKGSRADQHSTGDGKYSQMGEPWDMETQDVRLDIPKIKDIRIRGRED